MVENPWETHSISKLANKIARSKTNSKKDELFLSVYGEDRENLLRHIILSMPPGHYLLKREGQQAPSLEREIINKYGVQAGTSNIEKTVRGLSTTHPDKVSANFTLGLDELTLKAHPKAHRFKRNESISGHKMPRITPRMPRLR